MEKETEVLNTYIANQQEKINTLTQQIMFLETRIKLLENENKSLKDINSQYYDKYEHKRSGFSTVESSSTERNTQTKKTQYAELTQFKPAEPSVKRSGLKSLFKNKE